MPSVAELLGLRPAVPQSPAQQLLAAAPVPELQNSHGGSFMTSVIKGLGEALMHPGNVYAGTADPYDTEQALNMAGTMMGGGVVAGGPKGAVGSGPIRAYHGSPHDFDKFSLDKIGTGEGAQVYGHGLYFAENPGIARSYRDALATGPRVGSPEDVARRALDDVGGDRDAALKSLNERLNTYLSQDRSLQTPDGYDNLMAAAAAVRSGRPLGQGRMYEVAIHADPERFLDWDKTLAEQSKPIREVLGDFGFKDPSRELSTYDDALLAALNGSGPATLPKQPPNPTGGAIYESSRLVPGDYRDPVGAARALNEAGIPGIKYLDAGSRSAGDGSRNLVVFNDQIVEILRKYGVASIAALPPAVQAAIALQQSGNTDQ